MAEKIKEKRPVSQKTKEKVRSVPKELLRRGLLDGTEKLYGQLRDTAQGGQGEDTAADRVQGTTERGARLAVDRLGRMRLGKKKEKGPSSDTPPGPAPTSSDKSELPVPTTERVQIKTRDAVHDAPFKMYGEGSQSERIMSNHRSSVKTKDAYIHRQVNVYGEVRQKTSHASEHTPQTPEHTVPVNSPRSVQQTVKTKESFIRRQIIDRDRRSASPAPTSQPFPTQPKASQSLEQGKQRFIRERVQKAAVQKVEGHRSEGAAPVPAERHEIIESPSSPSGRTSLEPVWNEANTVQPKQKISGKGALDDKFPIKEARSEQLTTKRSARKAVKVAADSPRQAVKTSERSGKAIQQGTHAAQQTTSAVQQSARVAQQIQAPRRAVQAAGEAKRKAAAVGRPAVKAAVSALRGAVSAIRAAMAPLAAGGGAVVTVVLVLCMVGALLLSPLGVLFSGEASGSSALSDAIQESHRTTTSSGGLNVGPSRANNTRTH